MDIFSNMNSFCGCMLFCVVYLCIIPLSKEDILGCGGFVKSDIDINFSRVEVKLYTKQGTLKDHTDCAPNNGYYFLPLYDKGEYILKIDPPAGWSFEPKAVTLNIDGSTDKCSQGKDINFIFKGFAVTGRVVSSGSQIGPKGVTVTLFPEGKHDASQAIHSTVTNDFGDFLFTPVLPGKYSMIASHPSWKLTKNTVNIHLMKENVEIPVNSLIVAGYDVSGRVTSDAEPIKGVSFILFETTGSMPATSIQGCDKSPLKGFKTTGVTPLCHVNSDEKGEFVFQSLPPGSYKVLPHYEGPHSIKFDVRPVEVLFTVHHQSLKIETEFKVKGFSVSGRILQSSNGKGVEGATILLDGKDSSVTKADGSYHLENMQAGSYLLQVKTRDMKFRDMNVKITPNTPQLPDIIPSSYKVCGHVAPHKLISSSSEKYASTVVLSKIGSTGHQVITEAQEQSGNFCVFLEPGKYEASVKVSEEEKFKGLLFHPSDLVIEVVDGPILSGIEFTQLKVKLSGKIFCIGKGSKCTDIPVHLRAVSEYSMDSSVPVAINVSKDGSYMFLDVLPGKYEVSVDKEDWCWESSSHIVTVGTAATTDVPAFRHTGYTVKFISTHDTEVHYKLQVPGNTTAVTGNLAVKKGTTKSCVAAPGLYEFTPLGCHGFEQNSVRWDSAAIPVPVVRFIATSHTMGGRVLSTEKVADLFINVLTEDGKLKTRLGPLTFGGSYTDGKFVYDFEMMVMEGESLMLEPTSGALLFSPPRGSLMGAGDCIRTAVEFYAEKGWVIEGSVIPPSAGIKITVTRGTTDEEVAVTETSEDGNFKIGPLQGGVDYRVKAEKEGFVLTGPDANGNFNAHKLAEVVVEVVDKADGKPLQGVLLSLSGGESFRRNSQTGADGRMTFSSLSPSEYFLKPMMKEYRFEPPSKIIPVKEGATMNIKLSGHRVAYSAYGVVTSLNGEPEEGGVVEAVGQGKCSHFQEESSTESNGQFRIRGLQPECDYIVRMKEGPEINQHVERATPAGTAVKAVDGDVKGLRLIVFHPLNQMDLTVNIQASSADYMRTLRAKLCREDTPDSPVHVVKLDSSNGKSGSGLNAAMLVFPSVPADGRGYFLQLESSLSHQTHTYTTHAVHFKANSSFKLVKLSFNPKPKILEQELGHSSYFALPLMILGVMLYLNQQKVLPFLNWMAQYLNNYFSKSVGGSTAAAAAAVATGSSGGSGNSSNSNRISNTNMDLSASDAVVVEPVLNVTKRKAKPRKT